MSEENNDSNIENDIASITDDASTTPTTDNSHYISQINEAGQLLQELLIETASYLTAPAKTGIRHTMLKSSFASAKVLLDKLEEEIG